MSPYARTDPACPPRSGCRGIRAGSRSAAHRCHRIRLDQLGGVRGRGRDPRDAVRLRRPGCRVRRRHQRRRARRALHLRRARTGRDIRFYKGAANTGTHTGSLWSGGARVATAACTSKTASGWQTVRFATPVKISAGATYWRRTRRPGGATPSQGLLRPAPVAAPLRATAGTYTYGGGYPTSTYRSSNYYVDVAFTPAAAAAPVLPAPTSAPTARLPRLRRQPRRPRRRRPLRLLRLRLPRLLHRQPPRRASPPRATRACPQARSCVPRRRWSSARRTPSSTAWT